MSPKVPEINIPIISGIILMMGGFAMGLTLAYSSPTLDEIQTQFKLSSMGRSMFVACSPLAGFVGSPLISILVINRYGKNVAGVIAGFIGAFAYIGMGLSQVTWLLFLMRVLTGMSNLGFYSAICPVYLAEIAPEGKSGFYGFLNQVGLCLGFLFSTIFGFFAKRSLLAYICSIPSFIFMIGIIFIPSKDNQAKIKTKFSLIFKYKKKLVIAFFCMFFLQFSGLNAILGNLQPIIESSKVGMESKYVALIANIVQVIATFVATFLIDKLGYRLCWIVSTIGQFIAFLLLFFQQQFTLAGAMFMVGLFLEQFAYGIGTGPIPFSYVSQIFNSEVRSIASSLATACSWLLSAIVCFLWPVLEDAMNNYSYIFFAVLLLASAIFGFFAIVNTKKDDESSSSSESITRRLSKRTEDDDYQI
ncbi:major facilitator superfamily transporter [Histomonas meleagridis]|uniref:major facilitator superfamily transporter n=1 Tax=Histomonas meleagridis TaxID=135588 RepID=UPI0035594D6F|nr:major facilitator superfamily transporter [Histomonas meleagridis]KAH0796310.1 major facilitator superfamily transporter [Histomonas meleagridis]